MRTNSANLFQKSSEILPPIKCFSTLRNLTDYGNSCHVRRRAATTVFYNTMSILLHVLTLQFEVNT